MKAGAGMVVVGLEQAGIELDRLVELGFDRFEFDWRSSRASPLRGMGFREIGIELERALARLPGFITITGDGILIHE